ncbi:MAG: family 43 glycosylhydrolase [Ruminococcus callidus]
MPIRIRHIPQTGSSLYAPDVVQGNDGRFYLYYCMSGRAGFGGYNGPISVAVSDSPAGPFRYLGFVHYPDGSPMLNYICFDPGVINDDGTIRIYYGTWSDEALDKDFPNHEEAIQTVMQRYHKSRNEVLQTEGSVMGPCTVTVGDDMLTVTSEPRHIIPAYTIGTSFEEHPFFEASSIRKIGGKYYFIYSSWQNHELCYATSDLPDRDFVFGGTIVSNGDVGYHGRSEKDRLNMTGTTHGSIECINGQWYVFYHRLTHKSDYSRQACAEPITILPDGSIPQVEITSCGLNGKPLHGTGTYPAVIACNITNGHMPHGSNKIYTDSFPNATHCGEDRFIGEIQRRHHAGIQVLRILRCKGDRRTVPRFLQRQVCSFRRHGRQKHRGRDSGCSGRCMDGKPCSPAHFRRHSPAVSVLPRQR